MRPFRGSRDFVLARVVGVAALASLGCVQQNRVRPVVTRINNCQKWQAGESGRLLARQFVPENWAAEQKIRFLTVEANGRGGCVVRPVPECEIPGAVYSVEPTFGKAESYLHNWAQASAGVDLGPIIPFGSKLHAGQGDTVLEQWQVSYNLMTPAQFTTADFAFQSCKSVTHMAHRIEAGAWALGRGTRDEVGGNINLFQVASLEASFGNQRIKTDSHGAPNCQLGRNCVPVWFHMRPLLPGSGPCQGAPCGGDADMSRRLWMVTFTVSAPTCVDGVGRCELGVTLNTRLGPLRFLSAQDTPMAQFSQSLDGASLSNIALKVVERDEFQDDLLGSCNIAVQESELRRSTLSREPIIGRYACGSAQVDIYAAPQ